MRETEKQGKQDGFTVIEVLLAVFLTVIVLGVIINFFLSSQSMYNKAQERVDAQSQLRLNMDHLKEELSFAGEVTIYENVPAEGDFLDGYAYFYVVDHTLVLREGTDAPAPLPSSVPLPGLKVLFSKSNLTDKVVRVSIQSNDEGSWLASDILIQNSTGAVAGDINGSAIAFRRI